MNTKLDPTLLPALDAIYGLLGERPAPRKYAPQPEADATDYHVLVLHRELERRAELRDVVAPDAADYFYAEQCPSDAHFGR